MLLCHNDAMQCRVQSADRICSTSICRRARHPRPPVGCGGGAQQRSVASVFDVAPARNVGYVYTMFMPRDVHSRPRPPVPPRPNKHILDEAIAKSKTKVVSPDGVISVTKNGGPNFKNGHQALGQHVHENGHRRPTVLLITNGKTLVQEPSPPRIKHSAWYEVEESGRPVKYSSCQITLDGSSSSSGSPPPRPRPSMSSLQGLPPLPKSLSGINLMDSVKVSTPVVQDSPRSSTTHQLRIPSTPPPPPPSEPKKQLPQRKMTTLDTQLAILRKEMVSRTRRCCSMV